MTASCFDAAKELIVDADLASFERGVKYAEDGHVTELARGGGVVFGTVEGSHRYRVRISKDDWSCECPVAVEDGRICKHTVAVALLITGEEGPPIAERGSAVQEYLRTRGQDDLIDLVLEAMDDAPAFATRLSDRAARAVGDLGAISEQLEELVRRPRKLDARSTVIYGRQLGAASDLLEGLIEAERPEAVALIQRTLVKVVRLLSSADDASGAIGSAAVRLLELHARACAAVPPKPLQLVRWLVKFSFDDQQYFSIDIADYAEPLGERGIAAFRQEVEARIREAPTSLAARRAQRNLAAHNS
ncbi:SWIM zinc finger family protein [Tenggerimyces flavus]|uniref:SWIM zinc finger domain-containing protein n=1 Tax=Tenggerimyces flavus TaxID=1708749 RepID=A0ABV7YD53_9ACTN|nr:SWIM zinc finger family protein [Tenggerimyces flavus]MBM7787060.1 hypothetical protein [Tenggerimyces flavus]